MLPRVFHLIPPQCGFFIDIIISFFFYFAFLAYVCTSLPKAPDLNIMDQASTSAATSAMRFQVYQDPLISNNYLSVISSNIFLHRKDRFGSEGRTNLLKIGLFGFHPIRGRVFLTDFLPRIISPGDAFREECAFYETDHRKE